MVFTGIVECMGRVSKISSSSSSSSSSYSYSYSSSSSSSSSSVPKTGLDSVPKTGLDSVPKTEKESSEIKTEIESQKENQDGLSITIGNAYIVLKDASLGDSIACDGTSTLYTLPLSLYSLSSLFSLISLSFSLYLSLLLSLSLSLSLSLKSPSLSLIILN
jgi:hypothetical protein